jgi:CheY-like chemotaxis protein
MKILYADDDTDDREFFAEILWKIDPEIKLVEAKDGIQTLTILEEQAPPDLIFLDINMPKLNGDDTLRQIRKNPRLNNIKVVMYSTSISKTSIKSYQALNANFLNKPHTINDGVSAIRSMLQDKLISRKVKMM